MQSTATTEHALAVTSARSAVSQGLQLRLEFPGALYHITARGNARQTIFDNNDDCQRFLDLLAREVLQQGWGCYAYCHYHWLLQTPQANLSRGMRRLNGSYSQAYNRRHARVGHLLQGRYQAIVVEGESHLLELSRYVVLNPVRAGMVRGVAQWRWSSYRAVVGKVPPPVWLAVERMGIDYHGCVSFGGAVDDRRA